MDNKFYVKVFNYIKKRFTSILIFILLLAIFTIKLPWSVYTPGGLISVASRLNNADIKDNYYLTYVSFIEGTVPSLFLASIIPEWDIIKNENLVLENEDMEDMNKRDKIYMQEAISNAIYVGYNKAFKKTNIIKEHAFITYIMNNTSNSFKVGDEILAYDDIAYTNYVSLNDYIAGLKNNEQIIFKVKRDKKEMEVKASIIDIDGESKIGIAISRINDYQNTPNIEYKAKASESGSSGGLMMSLAIYDALMEENIAKNRKISGTGTISLDGTVGEISGVKYKLAGAVKKKADIFLVPHENYEEAISLKNKYNYNIKIIEAKTFDQVLEELKK